MYHQFYEEDNKIFYEKLLAYMGNKKKEYHNLFSIRDQSRNSFKSFKQTKTLKYIQDLEKTFVEQDENNNNLTILLNDPNRKDEILYEMTINFVNDMINEIENEEVIIKCIKREKSLKRSRSPRPQSDKLTALHRREFPYRIRTAKAPHRHRNITIRLHNVP
jgi:hypothetical protein